MANGFGSPWPWPVDLIQQVNDIETWLESEEVLDLILCMDRIMCGTRERARRLLSHFGTISSVDYGNISYCICYGIMCDLAPVDRCVWARTIESPNNSGNMIEACLALARIVPILARGECGDDDLRQLLSTQSWATPSDVEGAVALVHAARGTTTFMECRFLPILTNAVVEIYRVCFHSPAACLFQGITRSSNAERLKQAIAEFDAMRLGWPGAVWALPGLTIYGWIILPIEFYPDRRQSLMRLR